MDGLGCHLPAAAQMAQTQPQITALTSGSLRELEDQIRAAVARVRGNGDHKPVLIIDNPDLLIATAADHRTGPGLLDLISRLREVRPAVNCSAPGGVEKRMRREWKEGERKKEKKQTSSYSSSSSQNVHACIITAAADEPLMSTQTTTLEKEHASTILSLAHASDMILSMRMLDTGVASDVSGVVRITRGGGACDEKPSDGMVDREYLYVIGVDGSCRVLERGE